jgi:hypothetical protein
MGAKPSKKNANKPHSPAAPAAPAVAASPAVVAVGSAAPAADAPPAWIDSNDPRKRLMGKIVLAAVWLYVAALWLLALDQTFHWGIFGPKVPPLP